MRFSVNLFAAFLVAILCNSWGASSATAQTIYTSFWGKDCATIFNECLSSLPQEEHAACFEPLREQLAGEPDCALTEEYLSPTKSTLGVQWRVIAAPPLPKADAQLLPF